jgi:hypothetical protein
VRDDSPGGTDILVGGGTGILACLSSWAAQCRLWWKKYS